jgi:hypothetical protein
MRRAVSVSLGSSKRDKRVVVAFKGQAVEIERIGTDGDAEKASRLFAQLDGKVDALSVGGVDLYIRLDDREYPLHAALKLVRGVRQTPVVDGRGLKHTLERRVFELAEPALGGRPTFRSAFIPVALDRLGLAQAISEAAGRVVMGDLIIGLGLPIPVVGVPLYKRLARVLLPLVGWFPLSMLFYGSGGSVQEPKYGRYFEEADLLAGDFLFMRKYLPLDLSGKTVITNTTTPENVELLRDRGVTRVITTTPRYDGRSFGTNLLEAALTAYAGKGRPLRDAELNHLIDELDLQPQVLDFGPEQPILEAYQKSPAKRESV